MIEQVAKEAHTGNSMACVHGIDADPTYFDREFTITVLGV
jgi:hypothetical protein